MTMMMMMMKMTTTTMTAGARKVCHKDPGATVTPLTGQHMLSTENTLDGAKGEPKRGWIVGERERYKRTNIRDKREALTS